MFSDSIDRVLGFLCLFSLLSTPQRVGQISSMVLENDLSPFEIPEITFRPGWQFQRIKP